MRAVVVFESMYGNTRTVAEAVGRGLGLRIDDVAVLPVQEVTPDQVAEADLVVVGGPTHMHTLSSARTRHLAAQEAAEDPTLPLEPDADGPGLREWLDHLGDGHHHAAAAFDTRIATMPALSGRASKAIDRRLRHHHLDPVVEPHSFLIDGAGHLQADQLAEAWAWGRDVAEHLAGPPTV